MINTISKKDPQEIAFKVISYSVVTILALFCVIPIVLIVSASFSSEESIFKYGYSLFPKEFSLEAYKLIFKAPEGLISAYVVTIFITTVGTLLGLIVTSMTAYVIWRKDFKFRAQLAFFIYFTSIFSGGLVPGYIWIVKYLELKNTLWVLMLPNLTNAWNIMIFRSYLNNTPNSLIEAAKIDGAGDFRVYLQIVMPIAVPGLAVVGMFQALYYWNDWSLAKLYIDEAGKFPLQFFLYQLLNNLQAMQKSISGAGIPIPDLPSQTLKMAMTLLVATPVFFVFPFVQKFLVKGISVGSVKG
ncbi:MAG: carbohydrate ABC transporter permease [Spirochaetaceae bacterium]